MELLATEIGYLNDLRILVEIYLEQLRTLTTIPLEARTAISRNTEDIYHFHQAFAAEIDALITGERIKTIKAKNASTAEAKRIERAIQKVCASFADQVNPSLYSGRQIQLTLNPRRLNFICINHSAPVTPQP